MSSGLRLDSPCSARQHANIPYTVAIRIRDKITVRIIVCLVYDL